MKYDESFSWHSYWKSKEFRTVRDSIHFIQRNNSFVQNYLNQKLIFSLVCLTSVVQLTDKYEYIVTRENFEKYIKQKVRKSHNCAFN